MTVLVHPQFKTNNPNQSKSREAIDSKINRLQQNNTIVKVQETIDSNRNRRTICVPYFESEPLTYIQQE